MDQALENVKWDILGISEIRRKGEEILEMQKKYVMYFQGDISGKNGIGFFVKLHLKKEIEEFKRISHRIVVLNIRFLGYREKWSIIQGHAPHERTAEEDKDKFYSDLTSALVDTHKNKIDMGDFNSQLEVMLKNEEVIRGKFGTRKRNDNGDRLINFALENKLTVTNSKFKKNSKRKWTRRSPVAKALNETDFILSNKPKLLEDVHIINTLNFNTDHRSVRGTLVSKEPRKPRICKQPSYRCQKIPEELLDKHKETIHIKTTQQEKQHYRKNIILSK